MFPFLCEIALCFIVSYHVALLFLSREPRVHRNGDAPERQIATSKVASEGAPASTPSTIPSQLNYIQGLRALTQIWLHVLETIHGRP